MGTSEKYGPLVSARARLRLRTGRAKPVVLPVGGRRESIMTSLWAPEGRWEVWEESRPTPYGLPGIADTAATNDR
jgi:hypothetical protein